MADPYISEIRLFPWNWAPKMWALCNGHLLSIAQNQALFALLGTTYGGDGVQTFALPDLRSRTAIHFGNGYTLGEMSGSENVTLLISNLPAHNHSFEGSSSAGTSFQAGAGLLGTNSSNNNFYGSPAPLQPLNPASIGPAGGTQGHNNLQPYLAMNYSIAIYGVFPSRN
jgi:microcystin-dependent protein